MNVSFSPQQLAVDINPGAAGYSFGPPIARDYVERDPYTGSYTVTPAAEEQILATRGLRMTDDITIAPIPDNYGLITWSGSVLTVS